MPEYAPSYTPLTSVGRLYEVGINGVGYMLAGDSDLEQQYRYQRATIPLDPPRLATTDTPFSENVERYAFAAFADWRGGRGQKRRSVVDAEPSRFHDSSGVDVFSRDGLKLVNAATRIVDLSAGLEEVRALAVIGDRLYYTRDNSLWYLDAPDGLSTTIGTLAVTPVGFVAGGGYWYATGDTTAIYRGTTSIASWVTFASKYMGPLGWGGGRLLAAYGTASGVYRTFTTLTDAGAEEVPGGRLTLPDGWSVQSYASGLGYVFIAANAAGGGDAWRSAIYAWDLTTYTPYVVCEFEGEAIIDIAYHQNQLLIRTRQQQPDGLASLRIFRGVIEESTGAITPFVVADIGGADPAVDYATARQPTFCIAGPLAHFAWPNAGAASEAVATGTDGIGALDLEGSGVARWWPGGTVADSDHDMCGPIMWQGRPTWGIAGDGLYRAADGTYQTTGWVRNSLIDGGSALDKIWDRVRLQAEVLPANTTVTVKYSDDSYATVTAVAAAALAATGTESVGDLGFGAKSVGLELTLTSTGAATPVLQLAQLQFHSAGLADEVLVLPVVCADQMKGLAGAPLDDTGPGTGAARVRTLQALAQSVVQVQDVDWHLTGDVDEFQVERVDVVKKSLRHSAQGEVQLHHVAVVQLRRQV